jgi:hypothetical protein
MKTGSLLASVRSVFAPKFLTDTGRTLALYFLMTLTVYVSAGAALINIAWPRPNASMGFGWALLAVAIGCGLMLSHSSKFLFGAAPALVGAAAIFLGTAQQAAASPDAAVFAIIATIAAVGVVWLVIDEHRIPLAVGLIICLGGFVLLLETFRFQDATVAAIVHGLSFFAVVQSAIKYVRHATEVD